MCPRKKEIKEYLLHTGNRQESILQQKKFPVTAVEKDIENIESV